MKNVTINELTEALNNTCASLENVMVQFGTQMTEADRTARWAVLSEAQSLLEKLNTLIARNIMQATDSRQAEINCDRVLAGYSQHGANDTEPRFVLAKILTEFFK